MKLLKNFIFCILTLCIFVNLANAEQIRTEIKANRNQTNCMPKFAIVDIQKVISASPQVKKLKVSQDAKNAELTQFILKAQADINKQTNEKNKKELAEKFEKQLIEKRESILKEYTEKLREADISITQQIKDIAVKMGYVMVFPSTSVVYGGDDITEAVIKVIK